MHIPPVQLSPIEHECPQLPQLLLSEINDESLTHDPMHEVYPAAQLQEPPVQLSPMRQEFPHRPQLLLSLVKSIVLLHDPMHHSCPAEQLDGPVAGVLPGNPIGGLLPGPGQGRVLRITCTGAVLCSASAICARVSDTGFESSMWSGVPSSR